jgi:Fe-S cluster assembly iron-binding protein IscA
MLTVSERAKQHLKTMLMEHTDDPEVGLRLSPGSSEQLGLALSREEPGDQVVMHEGAKVLLVAPEMNTLLDNATLDVQDSPDGPAFSFSLFESNRLGSN